MLAKVKERISNPSNTFILFNHWDRVEEDGEEQARKVKEQQLGKVTRIMAHDLNIFTEEMVTDRTFFVSAKQAINNAEGNVGNAQPAGTSGMSKYSLRTPIIIVYMTWHVYMLPLAGVMIHFS